MALLKRDTICARRRFNPLARNEAVAAAMTRPAWRGKRRMRRYTRRRVAAPVVARV